jgi:hypothetical protein
MGYGTKNVKSSDLVVTQCVFNQSRGYWLLFDVISTALTMHVMMHNTNSNTNEIMQVCGLIAFEFFCLRFNLSFF